MHGRRVTVSKMACFYFDYSSYMRQNQHLAPLNGGAFAECVRWGMKTGLKGLCQSLQRASSETALSILFFQFRWKWHFFESEEGSFFSRFYVSFHHS